jgi:hypothetical protein
MADNQKEYEEFFQISAFWSWVILIAFCALIMSWGMFVEMMVKTQPPHWDFGQLPDTPSESIYSTLQPPADVNIPYQMQYIPDAQFPPGKIKQ